MNYNRNYKIARFSGRKSNKGEKLILMEKAEKDVQRFRIWRDIPPRIVKMPKGPVPGAVYTTRQQVVGQFTQQTNVTTGGTGGNYIVQNGSTALYGQISFCLADLSQATTFSSLFDRYRIEKVMLRVTTRNSATQLFNIASPNQAMPTFYCAIDRDDSSPLSTINSISEYDNSIATPGNLSFDVELIPSVVSTIANASSTATSSVIKRSDEQWLDIAATTIPHFGVKWAVGPLQATSTSVWYWDVEAWYVVSFKNTR